MAKNIFTGFNKNMNTKSILKLTILSSIFSLAMPAAKKPANTNNLAKQVIQKVEMPKLTIPKDGTIVENIYGKGYPKPISRYNSNYIPQIRPFN